VKSIAILLIVHSHIISLKRLKQYLMSVLKTSRRQIFLEAMDLWAQWSPTDISISIYKKLFTDIIAAAQVEYYFVPYYVFFYFFFFYRLLLFVQF
jgi:hypothetical protein